MKNKIVALIIVTAALLNITHSAFAMNELIDTNQAKLLKTLAQDYGWKVEGNYTTEHLNTILKGGLSIENYISHLTGEDGQAWIKNYLGNAVFHLDGKVINAAYQLNIRGFVFPNTDIYLPNKFTAFVVVHELGDVLDNNIGGDKPAVWFGGGAADQMLADLGGHPEKRAFPHCVDSTDYISTMAGPESWPVYMNGGKNPADDFADTFLVAVVGEELPVPNVLQLAPRRLGWMDAYVITLTATLP